MQPERYRNKNDPISMFARGAKSHEGRPDASSKALGTLISVIGNALTNSEDAGKTAGHMVEDFLNMRTTHAD
eukprot:14197835-Alexandrium_andersonii.AAC.1